MSPAFQTRERPPVPFPHGRHMEEGLSCKDCHHRYEQGKNVLDESDLEPGKPGIRCQECHGPRGPREPAGGLSPAVPRLPSGKAEGRPEECPPLLRGVSCQEVESEGEFGGPRDGAWRNSPVRCGKDQGLRAITRQKRVQEVKGSRGQVKDGYSWDPRTVESSNPFGGGNDDCCRTKTS